MAMMCEECKCSTYYNDELDMYSCENGCACCNDPNYESDWDIHLRIIKQLREYINIHKISLEQDLSNLSNKMDAIDPDSKDFTELDFEYNNISGQTIALSHILDYIDNDLTKGV